MNWQRIIIISLIITSFIFSFYLYPAMPEKLATHWNAQGQANGYSTRFIGLFLMPLLMIFILLIFLVIPAVDPLKENIKKFRKYFDRFIVLMMIFFFYLHLMTLFWNLGFRFNFSLVIIPAVALIFYASGVLMEHAQRNWSIGIRTPWTISNEEVWLKTNKLGGKLFKISALISLLSLFWQEYLICFILLPVLASSIYLVIYSYLLYRKKIKNP
jgi:uncharacterized membrane protein